MATNSAIKTAFVTLNHPEKHGFAGMPEEICNQVIALWIADHPERAIMVSYNISPTGTPHLHMGLYTPKTMRFNAIKKIFPAADIETARGNKKQIYDYIHKTPNTPYADKGEEVVCVEQHGEVQGREANDSVVRQMHSCIFEYGMNVSESLEYNPDFYSKLSILKQMFAQKRFRDTPYIKTMKVVYHLGEAGSGKSYTAKLLMEEQGEENVFVVADYKNGFDLYEGQPTIFLDEFKGQVRLADFLMWLDVYRHQQKARYANTYMLWNEVHIASIISPEKLYEKLSLDHDENREQVYSQIARRIHTVCYHYKKENEYCAYSIPMGEYTSYDVLRLAVPDVAFDENGGTIQAVSEQEQKTMDDIFLRKDEENPC